MERDEEIRERMVRLEARVDNLASRDWVRELVQPIKEAALKTEHAITSLAVRFESLFASHDKLIQDRSDREREDHLKSNLTYTIREKWAPIVGFLLAVVALFGTVASGFAWWFVHYVLPNAK